MSTAAKQAVKSVKALIAKAENASTSDDALKFSQAACNSANALRALYGPGSVEDLVDSAD